MTVLTPGFVDDAAKVAAGQLDINRFDLTAQAIRVIFQMMGLLALSPCALRVHYSHRRLVVPYVAPVMWNLAIFKRRLRRRGLR